MIQSNFRGKATIVSDIYSLGDYTCLYLLTGISPFNLYSDGEDAWVWRDYLGANFISARLAQTIDKMIARGTAKRYQSTQEILQGLNLNGSDLAIVSNRQILSSISIFALPKDICQLLPGGLVMLSGA